MSETCWWVYIMRDEILRRWSRENHQVIREDREVPFGVVLPSCRRYPDGFRSQGRVKLLPIQLLDSQHGHQFITER